VIEKLQELKGELNRVRERFQEIRGYMD